MADQRMSPADVAAWVDRYVAAWTSNDPADIGGLFTDDAEYRTEPYAEPWRGRDEIVEKWLAARDEPGEWEFRYEQPAVADDVAFVEAWTTYGHEDKEYANLWVIRLDGDGRCSRFTEWYMQVRNGA
jgi:uncharacterized protein (TIGR02246 family)